MSCGASPSLSSSTTMAEAASFRIAVLFFSAPAFFETGRTRLGGAAAFCKKKGKGKKQEEVKSYLESFFGLSIFHVVFDLRKLQYPSLFQCISYGLGFLLCCFSLRDLCFCTTFCFWFREVRPIQVVHCDTTWVSGAILLSCLQSWALRGSQVPAAIVVVVSHGG